MKKTLLLLRFPFSLFLLPIYLFALSQAQHINRIDAGLVFIILHFLVYPASNGYNSYMDNDEGSIGGLQNPPKPTKNLFYITVAMDITALLLSLWLSTLFAFCILLYILASRAYSYRDIRLKKYPYLGLATVAVFQGAFIYFSVYNMLSHTLFMNIPTNSELCAAIASSLLLAAVYPLTQIYQHKADAANGDITISYKLGYMGTFAFSAGMFFFANGMLYLYFNRMQQAQHFALMQLITLPVVVYFLWWWRKVWKNSIEANFTNTMRMNTIASLSLNAYFIILCLSNK